MTLGIIDVGTNSIHLLIGILGLNGKFHVILKERDLTRLGEGGLARGALTAASTKRGYDVLQRYASIMKRCGVDHVEAVATSAVRDAKNGRQFVWRVRAGIGIPLRIISGREEARLIYLGVLQTHRFRHAAVIITIGGGSAQVIAGDGAVLRYTASVPLGGARLGQRFIKHDPPRRHELEALREYVDTVWAPVVRATRRHRWRQALGSSATIYQLMLAAYLESHAKPPKRKHQISISRAALGRLVKQLSMTTSADRIQLPGIDPRREDLALPTAIALVSWMDGCGVSQLRYASGSLREGLVIDYWIRHHQGKTRAIIEDPLAELLGVGAGREINGWKSALRPSKRLAAQKALR